MGRKRKRKGKSREKKERKLETCTRVNSAGGRRSLSQELRVTSEPAWEGNHVTKLLPLLLQVNHHLPWLLALHTHLLKQTLHCRGYWYANGRTEQASYQRTTLQWPLFIDCNFS